jgi:hypothetical protein
VLRKTNGTIDISSALTASMAEVRFDGFFMFVSSSGTLEVAEVDVAGILGAERDLAHTPLSSLKILAF